MKKAELSVQLVGDGHVHTVHTSSAMANGPVPLGGDAVKPVCEHCLQEIEPEQFLGRLGEMQVREGRDGRQEAGTGAVGRLQTCRPSALVHQAQFLKLTVLTHPSQAELSSLEEAHGEALQGLQPREKAKREATQQAKDVRLRYQEQVRHVHSILIHTNETIAS